MPLPCWRRCAHKAAVVQAFLQKPEHQRLSDREIARRCGVSHQLVARVRATAGSAATTIRLVGRGGVAYTMNVQAINAVRAADRQRHMRESQEPAAVEHRRQLAAAAYEAMRARIVSLGALTPAGQRCLARDWRRTAELERLDREVRAAGLGFVRGKLDAEALFHAAIAACERAWAETIGLLRSAQERR